MRSSSPISPPPPVPSSKRGASGLGNNRAALPLILMFIVTLLAEGLALNADFYMDDFMHIIESEEVTGAHWDPPHAFRMLSYTVYRAVYSIAGPSSFAFHCLNFVLHFAVVIAVFAVGKLLYRRLDLLENDDARERAALVGALIFAAHPLCTEAVNYARCSMIQMVTLFSMLASYHVLRWLERPNNRSLSAAALFFVLATCSKGPGMFHVILNISLLCIVLAERGKIQRLKGWLNAKSVAVKIAMGMATIAVSLWLIPKWFGITMNRISVYGVEYVDHVLTQARMLWSYLSLMILPINLHSDHHIAVSRSVGDDPIAIIAMTAVAVLCAVIAVGLFKKKTRIASLLAALVLGHLLLRFAYPIHEHFVEYRTYPSLPWIGVIAGLGFGMLAAVRLKPALMTAIGVIALGCAASAMRSAMWSNSALLARDSVEAYELNNRPRCQLQVAAYKAGRYEEVLEIGEEIHTAYGKLFALNQNHPQKREYDPNRALDDLLDCERMKAFAITELQGSKAGIAFASERIDHFRERMAPGRRATDYEAEVEKALEALLSTKQFLTTHGEEYDRRKKEQHQLSAKADAPEAAKNRQ